MDNSTLKNRILPIVGLFILAAIIVVVVLMIQDRGSETDEMTNTNPELTPATSDTGTPGVDVPPDDDQDGLSNAREQELGTNASSSDSDSDGITDYDEVEVYGSDPLKTDTDGDGNSDGTEVQNGYSPTDDSVLLDLESEKAKFNE